MIPQDIAIWFYRALWSHNWSLLHDTIQYSVVTIKHSDSKVEQHCDINTLGHCDVRERQCKDIVGHCEHKRILCFHNRVLC